jgi:hypothetical protein
MTTIKAMKMALGVLEYEYRHCNRYYPELCRAIEALEHVIPQEEQKLVPVKTYSGGKAWPVQTEWVGLTDEEAQQIRADCATTPPNLVDVGYGWAIHYARAVEQRLKEKNSKG